CHINVPKPIGFHQNVLLMQYLGTAVSPSPELRKSGIDMEDAYSQVRESMRLLCTKAKLVHADLSEYNMLTYRRKVYMIDFGQSVSIEHPSARLFLERDVRNVCNFFNKKGIKCDVNDLLSFVTGESG
ncbi:Non-specific serine/threonine protein kinase, partial [mine drainage metagenome]